MPEGALQTIIIITLLPKSSVVLEFRHSCEIFAGNGLTTHQINQNSTLNFSHCCTSFNFSVAFNYVDFLKIAYDSGILR